MPRITSAKKALRQSLKRRRLNRKRREAVKEALRRFKKSLTGGKIAEARDLVPGLYKTIDKAAKRGRVLKKNTAGRRKARLMAMLKKAALAVKSGS